MLKVPFIHDKVGRLTSNQRVRLGDPDFLPDLKAYQMKMINDSTAQARRKKLSDSHTLSPSDYNDSGTVSIEKYVGRTELSEYLKLIMQ